jgi:replicative DNA helicase
MADVKKLIESISKEVKKGERDIYDAEGLVRLQEVAKAYEGEYKLIWSDDLIQEMKDAPRVELKPVKDLPMLNDIIGGFREQQLITVSAHSKHGKTAWLMFMVEEFEALHPVMIPLEQSNEELVQQRIDNGYSIPRFLSPRRLAARVTAEWIEERVVEGIAKYNTKLVVIDHLGYIDDQGEEGRYARENHAYRIEMIMKSLKNIAKRWNVIIMLAVHISQNDEAKPPTLQELKGSSAILQESDMVMMLWRKNEQKNKVRVYSNKTMISVLANRRTGKNGSVGLEFDGATGRYREENGWVQSMIRSAEAAVQADENFSEYPDQPTP